MHTAGMHAWHHLLSISSIFLVLLCCSCPPLAPLSWLCDMSSTVDASSLGLGGRLPKPSPPFAALVG